MQSSAHVMNHDRLVVHVPREVPRGLLQDWADDLARMVEERIASDYASERVGGRAMRDYGEAHEQRKARDGMLMEKGHMTGELANELEAGGFARITIQAGRIDIRWVEQDLIDRVPHAEPFAKDKTSPGRILYLLSRDAIEAARYIRERLNELGAISDRGQQLEAVQRGVRVTARPSRLGTRVRL